MKVCSLLPLLLTIAAPALAQDEVPDPKEQQVPASLGPGGQAIVAGLNQFGFDLYGKVVADPGDLAISPASI